MVKVYHNTTRRYMKGYGHLPVRLHQTGEGVVGEVLFKSAKQASKYALPMLKQAWSNMSENQKARLFEAGLDLGIYGAKVAGRKIKQGVDFVGEKAQEQLDNLVGAETGGRISKEAQKLLKKMAGKTKKRVKKELKKNPVSKKLPASVRKNLSKAQQKQLDESSQVFLSNLLAGQGLKLL